MVGIRSAKSCQTDFQNSRAITVRATPDRRGPAGGATCSDPPRGLYGGHVPRRESPAMYRVRPYRPFALALLVGALACTIRVIQPAPAGSREWCRPARRRAGPARRGGTGGRGTWRETPGEGRGLHIAPALGRCKSLPRPAPGGRGLL